ncbi:DUF2797 domain-containing protein [Marinomonas agarivorans]|nr:DUF2797 domain-containing protein [Marinomonas agarivorans]
MITGTIQKMLAQADEQGSVHYHMRIGQEVVGLNALLGQKVSLDFSGQIICQHCQKTTKKSFNQGYCYRCFTKLAACDTCIMSPEKCHYHKGTCRQPEWADEYCMQSHYVYLANSSGLKVGITRGDQLPTRWLDQGAIQGRAIFKVMNRRISGLVETAFKQEVADKTNWRAMLKGDVEPIDLEVQQEQLLNWLSQELDALQFEFGLESIMDLTTENKTHDFSYPVLEFPNKITSINAEKTPKVEGQLLGIKGQYWLLDSGVINIRKYTGYEATFTW